MLFGLNPWWVLDLESEDQAALGIVLNRAKELTDERDENLAKRIANSVGKLLPKGSGKKK